VPIPKVCGAMARDLSIKSTWDRESSDSGAQGGARNKKGIDLEKRRTRNADQRVRSEARLCACVSVLCVLSVLPKRRIVGKRRGGRLGLRSG
jgi:hypothetical protein